MLNQYRDVVLLDVSGTIFKMEKEVFLRIPLFKRMYSDVQIDVQLDANNTESPIWIPRSPIIFQHILAKAIDDDYIFPSKYRNELKYYELEDLECKCYIKKEDLIIASSIVTSVNNSLYLTPSLGLNEKTLKYMNEELAKSFVQTINMYTKVADILEKKK